MPFKSSPEHTPRNALQCFSFDFSDSTVYQRVLQRSCGSQHSQQETGLTFIHRPGPSRRHRRARSSGLSLDAMSGIQTNTSPRNSQTLATSNSPQNSQLHQHIHPYSISPKNVQQPQPTHVRQPQHTRMALQPTPSSHSALNARLNIPSSPSTHLPLNPNPATHLSPPSYLPSNTRQTIHPSPPFHQTPHPRLAYAPTQPPHSPFVAPSPIYPDSQAHFPSHQDMPEQSAVTRQMVVIRRAPKSCPPSSPSALMSMAGALSGKKKKFFDDTSEVSEPKIFSQSAIYQADGKQTFKQSEHPDEYERIPVITLQQPPKGKMKRHLSSDSDSLSTTSANSSLSLNSSVNSETKREASASSQRSPDNMFTSTNSQRTPDSMFTEQLSTTQSPKRLKSDPRHEGLSDGSAHQSEYKSKLSEDSHSWNPPGARNASLSHTPPRHGQSPYVVRTQRSPLNRRVAISQEGFPLSRHTASNRPSSTSGFKSEMPNQPSNEASPHNDSVRLLESPRDDKPKTSPKINRPNSMSCVSHHVNKSASCIILADCQTAKCQQLSSISATTMKSDLWNETYISDKNSRQRGKERGTLPQNSVTDPVQRREYSSESRRENKSGTEKRNSKEPDIFIFPDVGGCDEVDGFDDPMEMGDDMDYSEQHPYNYGSVSGQKFSHWNNEGQQRVQQSGVYQYANSKLDSRQQAQQGYAHQRNTTQSSYMGHRDIVRDPPNTTFDPRTMTSSNHGSGGHFQNASYTDEHDSGSSRGSRMPKSEVGVMKTPRENRAKANVEWQDVLDINDNYEIHFDDDYDQFNDVQGRNGFEYASMQRRNDLNNNRGFNRVTSGQETQFRADNSGIVNTRADTNVRFISIDELSGSDMSCDDMDEYGNWWNDDGDGNSVFECGLGGVQRRGQGHWDETDGSGVNQVNKHAEITRRLRRHCSKKRIDSSTRDLANVNTPNDFQNMEETEKSHVTRYDTHEACHCDGFQQETKGTKQTQAKIKQRNAIIDGYHTREIKNVSSNQVLYNDRKASNSRAEFEIDNVHGHLYAASSQHESIMPFSKSPQSMNNNLLENKTSRSMVHVNKGEQINVSGDRRGKRKDLMKHGSGIMKHSSGIMKHGSGIMKHGSGIMNEHGGESCNRKDMNHKNKEQILNVSQHKNEPHRNKRALNARSPPRKSDHSEESGDEVDGLGDDKKKEKMSGNTKQKESDHDVVHIFGDDDDDDEVVPTQNVVNIKSDQMSPEKKISMLSREEAVKPISGDLGDGTMGATTSPIQVFTGSLPIAQEKYSRNNQANITGGDESLEYHPESETYFYGHKCDSRNDLSEYDRNYSVNKASSSVATAKCVAPGKSVDQAQSLHDISRERDLEFVLMSKDDMTLSLTSVHHSKAEFHRRSSDVTVRIQPNSVIPRTRSSPSKLGNDSCENIGSSVGTHQFHRPWISPPSAGADTVVGFSTPSSAIGFITHSRAMGVSTPSKLTDGKKTVHYLSSNYKHHTLDDGALNAKHDVLRQESPCPARDIHSVQQHERLSDSMGLSNLLDFAACAVVPTNSGLYDIYKPEACLTPDHGTELFCQSCPTRSRDEERTGKSVGSGRKRTQVERRLFFEDAPDEATSGAQEHVPQHVMNHPALLQVPNGQRGKRKSPVKDVTLKSNSPVKELNGQQLECALWRDGAPSNQMTQIDSVNRELPGASRTTARNVDDRPRREDEVDISIQVSEVMEETRELLVERLEQIHQANDNRCECARIEQDILQKALDMFRSLCDPNIVHENWHKTLRETNQIIRDSLDIAESYRQLCNHGRSVTGVFEGSVIIRVKCKTLMSVLDLCAMQRSGELQAVIYRMVCCDVTMKGKTIRVTLDSKNVTTCTEFLLKTLKLVQLKKTATSPKKNHPTKRVVRSTDNLLLSPTSPCPTYAWSNGRRSSTPALSSGSPLASLSSNTTPLKRERTFSFGETARIAFQELNLTEKDSPTSPFGSTSRLTRSPNVIMSPRAHTSSPLWLVTSPHLRTSPGTSPISSPRKLKRCDVIQEQENMADGLP